MKFNVDECCYRFGMLTGLVLGIAGAVKVSCFPSTIPLDPPWFWVLSCASTMTWLVLAAICWTKLDSFDFEDDGGDDPGRKAVPEPATLDQADEMSRNLILPIDGVEKVKRRAHAPRR